MPPSIPPANTLVVVLAGGSNSRFVVWDRAHYPTFPISKTIVLLESRPMGDPRLPERKR